jgi:uncharacterized protein YbjT (DUF2867 family)
MSEGGVVTVFGGTGFLGRRIVGRLCEHGFAVRVATRHPQRGETAFARGHVDAVAADVHDERSVVQALAGAQGAVNAVSLYVERANETFHAIHVEAARRVALLALRTGVERLVHVSGLGADPASPSPYIRKRGEGEQAVRAAFADAVVVRPAVMFGPDDAFLSAMLQLLRRLPVFPMFGRGETRLQPVSVEDVGEAIARLMEQRGALPKVVECAGPRVYSYAELLRSVAREAGVRRALIPVPFAVWRILARAAEVLPHPPVTRNQVELMEIDNVPTPRTPGLVDLGVAPGSLEETLRRMVRHS